MDSVVPKEGQPPPVRLFVGGLPPGVAASQLQQRFQPFGVPIVHILPLKEGSADGESKRSFCYVDLQPKDASSVLKCLTAYNHSRWLGHVLRVEVAKPDYLKRLKSEWEEDAQPGGFRPQRRAGKRKHGPLEDGEEEWDGIPLPLDTSKPMTLIVGPRRRSKKPKVLNVPLDPSSTKSSVKHTFPPPARVLPPPALHWEHPCPPASALYILQELWEQGGPPASPPTALDGDDTHDALGAAAWQLGATKGAAMPPPASLQVQQQQQAAKAAKQQQQQQEAAAAGQLRGAGVQSKSTSQPQAQPSSAPAAAASAPISAEKHAYLKVIKSLKTATQKEEAHAAAAAAAAAAKVAARVSRNAGKAGRAGAAGTAAGTAGVVQALQGRGAGTAGTASAAAAAGTSIPAGPAVVSFEDEEGEEEGVHMDGGMDVDLDRFGSDSEDDGDQIRGGKHAENNKVAASGGAKPTAGAAGAGGSRPTAAGGLKSEAQGAAKPTAGAGVSKSATKAAAQPVPAQAFAVQQDDDDEDLRAYNEEQDEEEEEEDGLEDEGVASDEEPVFGSEEGEEVDGEEQGYSDADTDSGADTDNAFARRQQHLQGQHQGGNPSPSAAQAPPAAAPKSPAAPPGPAPRLLGGVPLGIQPRGTQNNKPRGGSHPATGGNDLSRFGSDSEESFHDVDDDEGGGGRRDVGRSAAVTQPKPAAVTQPKQHRSAQPRDASAAPKDTSAAQAQQGVPAKGTTSSRKAAGAGAGGGGDMAAATVGQVEVPGNGPPTKGGRLALDITGTGKQAQKLQQQQQQRTPAGASQGNQGNKAQGSEQGAGTPGATQRVVGVGAGNAPTNGRRAPGAGAGRTSAGIDAIAARFGSDSEESFHDVDDDEDVDDSGVVRQQVAKPVVITQTTLHHHRPAVTQLGGPAPLQQPLVPVKSPAGGTGKRAGVGTGSDKAAVPSAAAAGSVGRGNSKAAGVVPATAAAGTTPTQPGGVTPQPSAAYSQGSQAGKSAATPPAAPAPAAAAAAAVAPPVDEPMSAKRPVGPAGTARTASTPGTAGTAGTTRTASAVPVKKPAGTAGFSFSFFGSPVPGAPEEQHQAPAQSPPAAQATPAAGATPAAAGALPVTTGRGIGSAHRTQEGSRQQKQEHSIQQQQAAAAAAVPVTAGRGIGSAYRTQEGGPRQQQRATSTPQHASPWAAPQQHSSGVQPQQSRDTQHQPQAKAVQAPHAQQHPSPWAAPPQPSVVQERQQARDSEHKPVATKAIESPQAVQAVQAPQAVQALQTQQPSPAPAKSSQPRQPAVTPAPVPAVKPVISPVDVSAPPRGAKPRTGPLQFATTFMRTKSSEEVRAAWLAQREALAESFRQTQRTATKQSSRQQGVRKPGARR